MLNIFKNKFLLIISLCIITFVILIVGVVTLYTDNSKEFLGDGYVISATIDSNDKYYFNANTKYKANVNNDITFNDNKSNSVAVSPESFVHYENGSIAFLKKGALVNLEELTNSYINYYNVKDNNLIEYDDGIYSIETNNNKTVNISSFVGRISDKKYIIAGKDLKLKVPDRETEIEAEYFEVLFIEDGIAKIVNEDNEFQVTAQGTYFYIGNDIIINLGDGKISYDGEVKMLLSQITINGDENIDLKPKDNTKEDKTDEDGAGEDKENEEDKNNEDENQEDENNEDENNEDDENKDDEEGQNNNESTAQEDASIELVSANVTATSIEAKLLLNKSEYVSGELKAYITNVSTGNEVDFTIDTIKSNTINLENGTFDIATSDTDEVNGTKEYHLYPDTEYLIRIASENNGKTTQYFQKILRTKSLGITLEKMYATENSLKYRVNFDENSSVTNVYLNIEGNDVQNTQRISSENETTEIEFNNLKSNKNYSVYLNNITISEGDSTGITYANRYNISRIDSTLKKAPSAKGRVISVNTDTEKARFTITLDNIDDPDNSITGYTYEVYENDGDGTTIYSTTKNVNNNTNDAKELILDVAQIDELKQGVSYKCRVLINYNNNEMAREVEIDDGAPFSLKSIPSITWDSENFTIGKYDAKGTINLVDASCSVPISGRRCSDNNSDYSIKNTTFILKYYKVDEDEKDAKQIEFKFNPTTLKYEFNLEQLLSNTDYIMKVYGSYYDDNNIYRENVSFGTAAYFKTAKSDNLSLVVNSVNKSNDTNVINFDIRLDKGTSQEEYEEIVTNVSMNLYSGAYNNQDKLIGKYDITDKDTIRNIFNNLNINNGLFENITDFSVGDCENNKICNRQALINLTNNTAQTLNSSYTIEITSVKVGEDTLKVENPVYTFILTSSYYLDARIASNPNFAYVDVIPITKGELSENQINELKNNQKIRNIDNLLDDTVVGVKIDNNLSDTFVDSAFNYEKAVVNYIVHNNKTNKDVKVESVDMNNKYQPSTRTIWLDYTDTKDGFIRGYNYTIGYTIDFTIDSSSINSDEDTNVVTYGADKENPSQQKLTSTLDIERQKPQFTQYISTSTANSITYKYSMTDIDNALFDKKAYYSYSTEEEKQTEETSSDNFVTDGEYHTITIPLQNRVNYSWGYRYKKINDNGSSNFEMDNYNFESEYKYDNNNSFSIVKDNDNKLKIVLNENEVNQRAIAYKVTLSTNSTDSYSKIFLASKLEKYGSLEDPENDTRNKYIAIDYANISKFMKKNIKVSVEAFYDSGLVGLNQDFKDGLILKNIYDNTYLNIYNNGSQDTTTSNAEPTLMGVNFLRTAFKENDKNIYLYNLLMNAKNYQNSQGASYYLNNNEAINGRIGINFAIDFTNQGIVLNNDNQTYSKFNMNVSKIAKLNSDNTDYQFNTITPKITVETENTINSFKIKIKPSGIYSNDQFRDNKISIDVYSDADCQDKITTLTSNISISSEGATGYTATIDDVSLENLKPDTTYYFKIFAHMKDTDGNTQLYDSSSTDNYITKTYETKTLSGDEILNTLNFKVEPISYDGEISSKQLTWKLKFNNLENYKVRFELYKSDDSKVNFDGTNTTSCKLDSYGEATQGYVNDCYISIKKEDISKIDNKEQTYTFKTDDFVFGGNYYKLLVYAIPYTNNNYNEDDKVILYQNDSLSTYKVDGDSQNHFINISIPALQEANIESAELNSGYNDTYYIDFKPKVNDIHKVIRYGKYTLSLKDENGEIIKNCKIITNLQSDGSSSDEKTFNNEDCKIEISASDINNKYRFTNLSSDTLYSVNLKYHIYANNVTDSFNKDKENNYYQYTPSSKSGIRLGTVTGSRTGEQQITLNYLSSVNLNKIVKVSYTIQLFGGSSTYSQDITPDTSSMFVVSGNNVSLTLDFTDNDQGFKIEKGQTYKVNTKYYYDLNQQPLNETTFIYA